jgi:Mg-chelatase subunit ChlD
MEFLNLSFFEFLGIFTALSGIVVALYLLDRSRQRIKSATLRFWQMAQIPPSQQRRRRIQQPWSLLLQLLGIALLLLAASQLRWGASNAVPRQHVLLLDVSAASSAKSRADARTTVLAASQAKARQWLRALPAQDKVLVVETGSLLTPKTAFETKRSTVEKAIQAARSTSGSANLAQAFAFASQLQRRGGVLAGEIAYAGPARVADSAALEQVPPNLRLLVTASSLNNVGIRKASVRRSLDDLGVWSILITVKNYAAAPREALVGLRYGGVPLPSTVTRLAPNGEQTLTVLHRTKAAGLLELKLLNADEFPLDDQVDIELPALPVTKLQVYTRDAAAWRPLLAANPLIEARYADPAQFNSNDQPGFYIFDGFEPPLPAKSSALYLLTGHQDTQIKQWRTDHPVAAGIRSRDFKLTATRRLDVKPGEAVVLEGESGPLLTAGPNTVRLGFQPARSSMRQEVTGPLLMANIFRYLAPESYRQWESVASSPGAIRLPVGDATGRDFRVLTGEGKALPFSIDNGMLQTYAPLPGTVRILESGREVVFSLTLPDLPDQSWDAPKSIASGVPEAAGALEEAKELWRWLAIAAALVLFLEWRKFGKGQRAWLKYAMLAVIAAALFGPAMSLFETKLAVTILADSSQSLAAQDVEAMQSKIREIEAARGRHIVRVVPFARASRALSAAETGGRVQQTSGEAGLGTNLEAAIRDAIASTPADLVPHLVVISDGKETEGSAVQALWQTQQLNIPVDTFALRGRQRPQLNVVNVAMPPQAFAGEKFPVEISVRSPRGATAKLELQAEGKTIGSGQVQLNGGLNELTINSSVASSGVIQLTGKLSSSELGEARFDQAINIKKPRLLYVSGDPAGTEANFLKAVESFQFETTRAADFRADSISDYEVVVLNNQDLEGYTPAAKSALESYVKRGGGLLTIGGEKNQYVEKKPGTPEDPLERTLPAKLAPPRSPEGTCVVLIVDKSSSMEGRKMELARTAAIGVIENLRPIDLVGVLIFDNSHQWAIPIRKAEDKVLMKRLVAGVTPDGGTQIAPALAEAYKKIVPVKATFKHVVLLTDGISEEGDSINLAKEAATQRVTISTVGLGQDVNKGYLEKIAQYSRGKSYFLTDPSGLEQILLRDVMEFTGSTAVEKPTQPILMRAAETLEGIGIDKAPALKGYVKYEAKPNADLLLTVPGEKANTQDPLLARWQYGLGRVTVFTSDAKSRWADEWISWPGFDRFWGNTLRDLLPHSASEDSSLTFDPTNRELEVTYRLGSVDEAKLKPPALFAFGPNQFQQPVKLQRIAAGLYRGRIFVGDQTGLFRVRPAEVTRYFPETGYYRPEAELSDYGNNEPLLKQIAEFSNGRFQPRAGDIFRGGGKQIETSLQIWPWLLALALALNLIELFLRKGAIEYFRKGVAPSAPPQSFNPAAAA